MKKSVLACMLFFFVESICNAIVYTDTPSGSWRWATLTSVGKNYSTAYYPESDSVFFAATFNGYVTYDTDTGHSWYGAGLDTIQVFSTYVTSQTDQVISVRAGGDDGHSLFVDSAFVLGGACGATLDYELSLQAGIAKRIDLVGYNGPGNWVFGIGLPNGSDIGDPIESITGVTINAVPEPCSLVLLLMAGVSVCLWRLRITQK
jgi:hypothetical protein